MAGIDALRGNSFRDTVAGMFSDELTFMPAFGDDGDPTDGVVAVREHLLTRHIWLRRYDDVSRDGVTQWPVSICVQAEDLDADQARRVAAEMRSAADLIEAGAA